MNPTLIINEELKSLLPPLSSEEYTGLEASLLKDGCIAPLVTWNDTIVDGHHRYEICCKHLISFRVYPIQFASIEDAMLWAGRNQAHRRNLSPYHRIELATKLKESIAAKAKERQRAAGGDKTNTTDEALLPNSAEAPSGKTTREELAALAGVAPSTVERAEYIAKHADDATKAKLRNGEKGTSINKEYIRLKDEEKRDKMQTEPDTPASEQPSQIETPIQPETQAPAKPLPRPSDSDFVETVTLTHIPANDPERLIGLLFDLFSFKYREQLIVDLLDQMKIDDGEQAVKRIVAGLTKRFST